MEGTVPSALDSYLALISATRESTYFSKVARSSNAISERAARSSGKHTMKNVGECWGCADLDLIGVDVLVFVGSNVVFFDDVVLFHVLVPFNHFHLLGGNPGSFAVGAVAAVGAVGAVKAVGAVNAAGAIVAVFAAGAGLAVAAVLAVGTVDAGFAVGTGDAVGAIVTGFAFGAVGAVGTVGAGFAAGEIVTVFTIGAVGAIVTVSTSFAACATVTVFTVGAADAPYTIVAIDAVRAVYVSVFVFSHFVPPICHVPC